MLGEFLLAMRHGLGMNRILGTFHANPGRAEVNEYVAGTWEKAHAPGKVLRWLRRYRAWRRG